MNTRSLIYIGFLIFTLRAMTTTLTHAMDDSSEKKQGSKVVAPITQNTLYTFEEQKMVNNFLTRIGKFPEDESYSKYFTQCTNQLPLLPHTSEADVIAFFHKMLIAQDAHRGIFGEISEFIVDYYSRIYIDPSPLFEVK